MDRTLVIRESGENSLPVRQRVAWAAQLILAAEFAGGDILADFARSACLCRPIRALINTRLDDLGHQRVSSKGSGNQVPDAWVAAGCCRCQAWNVLLPMSPWQQEVRVNDHHLRSLGDTAIERLVDGWLSQFHVGWLDNAILGVLPEIIHNTEQHEITFSSPRSVVDDHDACFGVEHKIHFAIVGKSQV